MLVMCGRCGKVHEKGACSIKRKAKTERTEERRFRSTQAWTDMSRLVRSRDRYLCARCASSSPPRYVTSRLSVHHIVPVASGWSLRLDPSNLITLCPACHELAEAGEIPASELEELARKANEREGM